MFKYTLILIFCIISQLSFAQKTVKIMGTVVDSASPLEFVSVVLKKANDTTKVINYTNTDSLGRYSFDNLAVGEYQIKCSFMGYQPFSQILSITAQSTLIEVKSIALNRASSTLNEVIVTTQKKLIEKTSQGFIVNAAANIAQLGGTATDILRNTPTIVVDAEGGITLRGKTPLILINGRNSNLSNTDQIVASSIESIEIINNPTAKYDANAESGIINIKLKKNNQSGMNGAVALGTGYGSNGRINSSLLINNKSKKWNIGLGYDNRFARRTRSINASRTNFFLPNEYLLNQDRNDKRLEQLQNLKLNLDFSPNDKNNFSFEAIGNMEGQDNDETLNSILSKQNNSFNANTSRNSLEFGRTKVAEFALNYAKKYTDSRKSLSVSITSSLENGKENTDITTQSFSENSVSVGNPILQRTHNYENGNVSNIKVDYAFPIFKRGQIETGYKAIFRTLNADFETATNINNVYVINPASSNIFKFNEQVHAIYAQYSSFWGEATNPTWKYEIGIRAEEVWNTGKTENSSSNFENQYLKFFPSVALTYLIKAEESWKLSYSKRINRPSFGQLNPFIDITDALNTHSGNPNLKPEIIHALELGYNKEWDNYSFTSNLFYRYSLDAIRQYIQLQANGVSLVLPLNIGNAQTYGLENVFSAKPTRFYDVNASLSLFQQQLNGANLASDAVQNAFGWNGKLINNFVPWQGSKCQIVGNYNSALVTPQGNRIAQYNIDIGFQQKLGKGNARLGLTFTDVFNTLKSGYENNTTEFTSFRTSKADTRAIVVTFAYTFKAVFKENLLENQFSHEY